MSSLNQKLIGLLLIIGSSLGLSQAEIGSMTEGFREFLASNGATVTDQYHSSSGSNPATFDQYAPETLPDTSGESERRLP